MGAATMQRQKLPSGERYVSLAELAAIFGISRRHALDLANEGRIGHVRLGKAIRVPVSEVDRLRAEARRNGA